MQNGAPDRPNIIALPPLIYGVAFGLGLVGQVVFPVPFLPHPLAVWLGILLILVFIALAIAAFRALARAQTPFDARQPTTALVTDGAFRYSRNPMYLSMTLLYLGVAAVTNALWLLLLVVPLLVVIQRGVVVREEQYLAGKFGEAYQRYTARVRRWL